MDKKESKTAGVNGCKSKIGKVREWKRGGKCRRIRISRADVRRPRVRREFSEVIVIRLCKQEERKGEGESSR